MGGQTMEGNITAITDTVELYDVASNKLSQGESNLEFAKTNI